MGMIVRILSRMQSLDNILCSYSDFFVETETDKKIKDPIYGYVKIPVESAPQASSLKECF